MPPTPSTSQAPSTAMWAGVGVVIIVILVVAVVWVVPLLSHPASTSPQGPQSPSRTPLGTALAVAPPTEAASGTNDWYNFSVQSAGGGLHFGNLSFQIQTVSGAIVPTSALWTVTVQSITGTQIGAYSMVSASWVQGGDLTVTSGQTISIDAGSTQLSGDVLVVAGSGAFSGTISVSIP